MINLGSYLRVKTYPGRGIIVGRTQTDIVIAYFIMGRSLNSKNRIFEETSDGIKTKAFDEDKMVDPSLIIYSPVKKIDNKIIITNGDQTDTIYEHILKGKTFEDALRTRYFEPDEPNFTPRISAIVNKDGSFKMSILKSDESSSACIRNFYEYEICQKGTGRILHTYEDNANPIPSFDGEPKKIVIDGEIDTLTDHIWANLDKDNKVSLYVKYISCTNGMEQTRIVNKNK